MEIAQLDGYTTRDKVLLAQRHVIPAAVLEHGLPPGSLGLSAAAVEVLAREYSQEAGIRELARCVSALCRAHVYRSLARGDRPGPATLDVAEVREILGKPLRRRQHAAESLPPGCAYGMGWTAADGELLPIECALLPHGTGKHVVTGQLGEVLKESIEIAVAVLRRQADQLGIPAGFRDGCDLHVHLPSAGIRKDGPSAGLAIALALYSHVAGRPARADTAITGELTLHGRVTAVGGIKTKLLAAAHAGIRRALLPDDNRIDVEHDFADEDLPLEIVYVKDLAGAIAGAFP
jgi:ATP-dependent Lon protease